jgi:hypothetical protein
MDAVHSSKTFHVHMVLQPRRPASTTSPLLEPQISLIKPCHFSGYNKVLNWSNNTPTKYQFQNHTVTWHPKIPTWEQLYNKLLTTKNNAEHTDNLFTQCATYQLKTPTLSELKVTVESLQSCFISGRPRFKILGWNRLRGLSWFSSVHPRKFRSSSYIKPLPLPSIKYSVHFSSTIPLSVTTVWASDSIIK